MDIFLKNKKFLLFILTLQEAFSAIIPFFLLSSFITLSYYIVNYFHIEIGYISKENIHFFMKIINSFSSLVAVISISYFFAIRLKVMQIIAVILAITSFITVFILDGAYTDKYIVFPYGFDIETLFIPIISTLFLKYFYPIFNLRIPVADINHHIFKSFNYLFVFIISYIATISIYLLSKYIVVDIIVVLVQKIDIGLPDILILVIRDIISQVFWFFGVHGEHMVNGLIGKDILFREMMSNITYGEFNRMFVLMGGAGVGLGLLIALLLYVKNNAIKTISKISIPFVIFNINDLLIYAVIVLNRFFILPFILLPIFNLLVAYIVLHFIPVDFTTYYLTWTTPIFIDGYLKSGGNLYIFILQLFLIIIDILVYIYFVKRFTHSMQLSEHFTRFSKNLDISEELKSKSGIKAFVARTEIIDAYRKLDEIIESIDRNDLYVYYQPKIDIQNNKCYKFEALIRYKYEGKLVGPIFLDIIEKAGLAPIIDIWVCKQVKNDIIKWKKQSYLPQISINLHPDTLKSKDAIKKIVEILKYENVMFEIIERSFLGGSIAEDNLQTLKNNGFGISIDDFGTGYSSLETIIKHNIDELKLDKTLIDRIESPKGFNVCKYTVQICHKLDCKVVAEGVETKKQLKIVEDIDVDFVQGYYFSKAIPFEEVKEYAAKFK